MKIFFVIIVAAVFFTACTKETLPAIAPPAEQANYKVKLRLQWVSPNFAIPANAHFTSFIGMIQQPDTFLWAPNGLATVGLEFVAEVGSNSRLNNEIDSIIARGKALSRFGILPPAIAGGIDTIFSFTLQHSCISFASMIAPSPDWFVGLNQYNLLKNNAWINDITVPLYLYDAGTEDGDVFGYNNPASSPLQPVHLLTATAATVLANGNAVLAPIGSIRFTKL